MLDTPRTFTSGLEKVLETLQADTPEKIQEFIEQLDVTADTFQGWLEGKDIPQAAQLDLAAMLGIDPTCLNSFFAEEDRDIRMHGWVYNDREGVDGYWGNIGLKTAGSDKTSWFPISDEDCDIISSGPSEATALLCMGGSSLIIFPHNVREMTLLSEAEDQIEGDWDITAFDPVNGLPPVVLYAVSQFDGNLDEFDRQEAFRPETTDDRTSYKFSGYMADQVKYLGGEDAVSKFVNTVEIQFVDGETREVYVETHDKTLRSLFAAVMEFGSAGAGVHLSEEPTRFFSTRDIAWIRFPSFHVVGYMKIEV